MSVNNTSGPRLSPDLLSPSYLLIAVSNDGCGEYTTLAIDPSGGEGVKSPGTLIFVGRNEVTPSALHVRRMNSPIIHTFHISPWN